ncbi:MAG: hypothetical protein F4Y54_04190 [Dehalococcoidia bacterium]|nr:hypothetical protein [Dehalococcoidia bacterium]
MDWWMRWTLSAAGLSAIGLLVLALTDPLGLPVAVVALLLGFVAIGVAYSIWKALHDGERQKPSGFLRDVVSSVVPLLALLGAALVFQGFGELVDWDAAGAFGRTVAELFGGS